MRLSGTPLRVRLGSATDGDTPFAAGVRQIAQRTLELHSVARERTARGQFSTSMQYAQHGVTIWNYWTEGVYPSTADMGTVSIWADVWAGAMANLELLGRQAPPVGSSGSTVAQWIDLIASNLVLLGPASNMLPSFFRVGAATQTSWLPAAAPTGYKSASLPAPCVSMQMDSHTGHCVPFGSDGAGGPTLALATRVESEGGALGDPRATRDFALQHPSEVMRLAPMPGSAGFVELLGPLPTYAPIAWGYWRATRTGVEGWGWEPGLYDDGRRADSRGGGFSWGFTSIGPGVQIKTRDHAAGRWLEGWDELWAQWGRTGGALQLTATGAAYASPDTVQGYTLNLGAFLENWRKYAAYWPRLNLADVLVRTTGFYGTSYASFVSRMGVPAPDLARLASQFATQVRNAANAATLDAVHTATGLLGAVAGVATAINPIAGVIISIYAAVIEGVSELLAATDNLAIGTGAYSVQPLTVRRYAEVPLVTPHEVAVAVEEAHAAADANVQATVEEVAARAAAKAASDRNRNFLIGGGVAAGALLLVALKRKRA